MSDFLKTVEKLANVKGVVTLLLILVVAIFVWRNLDFFSEVTFKLDRNRPTAENPQARPQSDSPSASAASGGDTSGVFSPEITRLEMSPVAFSLPSYFLVGISNPGLNQGYVDISLDFGGALLKAYEARPRDAFVRVAGDTGSSMLKGRFLRVDPEETVYIYALLSQPTFDKVIVRGSGNAEVKTAADLNAGSVRAFVSPTMVSWFRFVVSAVITVLIIMICALPFAWLARDEPPTKAPPKPGESS